MHQPTDPQPRQSDAEIASHIRGVARAMEHDRRWLRPLLRRTGFPNGGRLGVVLIVIMASLGLGMFARMSGPADAAPRLVVAELGFDGDAGALAAELRERMANRISGTSSLHVSGSDARSDERTHRVGGRLVEQSGVLTFHMRLDAPDGAPLVERVLTADVRRLDALVEQATAEVLRSLPGN
jgi:hypothetical protein